MNLVLLCSSEKHNAELLVYKVGLNSNTVSVGRSPVREVSGSLVEWFLQIKISPVVHAKWRAAEGRSNCCIGVLPDGRDLH